MDDSHKAPEATGPLVTVLAEFLSERMEDQVTRLINRAALDVHAEWQSRPNRDAYVDQAIREAAYRAVRDVRAYLAERSAFGKGSGRA